MAQLATGTRRIAAARKCLLGPRESVHEVSSSKRGASALRRRRIWPVWDLDCPKLCVWVSRRLETAQDRAVYELRVPCACGPGEIPRFRRVSARPRPLEFKLEYRSLPAPIQERLGALLA
ncbi:hypothetical protein B0H11DRAFT_2214501 [Mycena galericulata]|nr:hypothetical protein B0H11DRAFT_2214501 [Mycena galericulata]